MDAINGKNRRIVTALHEVESLGVKSRNSSVYGDLVVNRLSMELIIRGGYSQPGLARNSALRRKAPTPENIFLVKENCDARFLYPRKKTI
jgi:hypothetical protein